VLSFEQWKSKSKSSLAAARILLEHGQPVEAASRAYYAAYQMVTGVLLRLKLSPRSAYGNWAHHETQDMYLTHICHKVDLQFKEKRALKSLFPKFRHLLITRYLADYGETTKIDLLLAKSLWRDANQLVSLLERLIKRGLL
jgi:uncharacterized protein (UPF0332 family)